MSLVDKYKFASIVICSVNCSINFGALQVPLTLSEINSQRNC